VYREGQRRLDAGDLDGARSAFLEARNLAPLSNTAIHSTYFNAIVLYRQEHFQEAESAFRELLDRYPEAFAAAESSYHVALCAERLGRLDDARAGFEDTARRFPGTQWADFADDRLRSLNPSPSARDANDTASPQRPAR
jgi:TolA-binding protein